MKSITQPYLFNNEDSLCSLFSFGFYGTVLTDAVITKLLSCDFTYACLSLLACKVSHIPDYHVPCLFGFPSLLADLSSRLCIGSDSFTLFLKYTDRITDNTEIEAAVKNMRL